MSYKMFLIGTMQKFLVGYWCKPLPKVWVINTSVVCCHTFGSGHTNNLLAIWHCSLNNCNYPHIRRTISAKKDFNKSWGASYTRETFSVDFQSKHQFVKLTGWCILCCVLYSGIYGNFKAARLKAESRVESSGRHLTVSAPNVICNVNSNPM